MKAVKTAGILDFCEQCSTLVDDLLSNGILICRHGQPIARIVPVRRSCADLIGSVPDLSIDPKDNLSFTPPKRDAEF